MNKLINSGLIKASAQPNYLKHLESVWLDGQNVGVDLPDMLKRAVLTAWVLQITSLFDEALEDFVSQKYPDANLTWLHNRIEYLTVRGDLADPAMAMRLKDRRNELAHDTEAFATRQEWNDTYAAVQAELRHLGIVA